MTPLIVKRHFVGSAGEFGVAFQSYASNQKAYPPYPNNGTDAAHPGGLWWFYLLTPGYPGINPVTGLLEMEFLCPAFQDNQPDTFVGISVTES